MNETADPAGWGELTQADTLQIRRLLPGPIERVWAYLTESDLRRQWLASGKMTMEVGSRFEFVWRNDELTDPPGRRPENASVEHRMGSRITEADPPHRLSFEWGSEGDVTFELQTSGDGQVLLTVTHRRITERSILLSVSSGWHAHLDVLVARLANREPKPFWDNVHRVKSGYEKRLSG